LFDSTIAIDTNDGKAVIHITDLDIAGIHIDGTRFA
jgi:hypothetical protein